MCELYISEYTYSQAFFLCIHIDLVTNMAPFLHTHSPGSDLDLNPGSIVDRLA